MTSEEAEVIATFRKLILEYLEEEGIKGADGVTLLNKCRDLKRIDHVSIVFFFEVLRGLRIDKLIGLVCQRWVLSNFVPCPHCYQGIVEAT